MGQFRRVQLNPLQPRLHRHDCLVVVEEPDRRFVIEQGIGQLLQKANALLYDEAPVWFFNYNKAVMAVQPWLKGIQLNATELTHQNVEDLWVDETSPAK